ncbi:hypothetical protein LTR99_002071 [Exophiala xenobiotica]|jgi:uncharacterized protein YukJ|uniref:DUF2278 family protein n=1 Tax=Vermiconidia calcicola TaxID=1690605 RepID=A0AAV9QG14_9PEZI|nr:hypothetical protein H2202_007291 [Exophiala xenobiotica]KAK5533200.1 hypothetical protein LTR23_009202 [Chaetothyriales sp. CCFEE 6169]KAK5542591.1 hypothetical protein LTR25_002477 [Vermiconidia calcicola]KAK5195548.1 hypothetical protein LTR92_004488 [Exophiala xenobiotica]KAK5211830.1 hypothetical protein LTR41_002071 [Exophiala xenobiotica]
MPIQDYGVWKGKPVSYKVDPPSDSSPHINLVFTGDGPTKLSAAINVKSTSQPSQLVYWFDRNFSHPLTQTLAQLDYGFQAIDSDDSQTKDLALDYVRTPDLLQLKEGRVLPFTEDGPDNDILDELQPILDDAIQQKADIYLYGSSYGTGIHDIHMNQGSPGFDNGVGQDGAFLLRFPDEHWEAVFLAFASQRIPTDDTSGDPLSGSQSQSLESIIESGG